MKKLFISSQLSDRLRSILQGMGFFVVPLPACTRLDVPVSCHADMLIFSDGVHHITTRQYYDANKELFGGIDLILTDQAHGRRYPDDVLLNAFVTGDTLFGLQMALCDEIRSLYPRTVNLSQGYAKCSTLLFGDRAVTADRGIADSLERHGCRVLRITPGHIALPGYDYGFIGGASTVYRNRVIFFGDITRHPDGDRINTFITEAGYTTISIPDIPLHDLGGAVIIETESEI